MEKIVNSVPVFTMPCWPLPLANHVSQQWERAYYAAIQGYYSAAFTELSSIMRQCSQVHWRSRATSLYGSLLRQLGHHHYARHYDGRALTLSGFACRGYDTIAAHDALVGLSADAIGMGRMDLAQRTLHRASSITIAMLPKQSQIYHHWVSAELAITQGYPDKALKQAQKAQQLSQLLGCIHYQCKTDMIYAAALCASGQHEASWELGQQTLARTQQYELIPLSWGLCCLLVDLAHTDIERQHFTMLCHSYRNLIEHRGGQWK